MWWLCAKKKIAHTVKNMYELPGPGPEPSSSVRGAVYVYKPNSEKNTNILHVLAFIGIVLLPLLVLLAGSSQRGETDFVGIGNAVDNENHGLGSMGLMEDFCPTKGQDCCDNITEVPYLTEGCRSNETHNMIGLPPGFAMKGAWHCCECGFNATYAGARALACFVDSAVRCVCGMPQQI